MNPVDHPTIDHPNSMAPKKPELKQIFQSISLFYGIAAGVLMGFYLLFINSQVNGIHTEWSFSKYLILGGMLGFALSKFKQKLPNGEIFKKGISLGFYISLYAAIALVSINTIINLIGQNIFSTERYNLNADNIFHIGIIDGVLFFECFVFGMVLNFIWLQFLKDNKPAR